MSGYNELDVAGTLPETGANFIQKPFSTAALLDKVAELLDR
jgi:FixJ family two-component response regulator